MPGRPRGSSRPPGGWRASGRAPTAVPLTDGPGDRLAHRRRRGRAGLLGGFLPVDSLPRRGQRLAGRHRGAHRRGEPRRRPDLRARSHLLSPSTWLPTSVPVVGPSYPARARSSRSGRAAMRRSAAASRSGWRVLTSQYGVGSAGSCDRRPAPRAAGRAAAAGRRGRRRRAPATRGSPRRRARSTAPRCSTGDPGPPGAQHAVARPRRGRAP